MSRTLHQEVQQILLDLIPHLKDQPLSTLPLPLWSQHNPNLANFLNLVDQRILLRIRLLPKLSLKLLQKVFSALFQQMYGTLKICMGTLTHQTPLQHILHLPLIRLKVRRASEVEVDLVEVKTRALVRLHLEDKQLPLRQLQEVPEEGADGAKAVDQLVAQVLGEVSGRGKNGKNRNQKIKDPVQKRKWRKRK